MHIKEINITNQGDKYYFDDLVKAKKLEAKNILIDERNYKGLTIYFTRYVYSRLINMLSFHYHELLGKTKEHDGKKILAKIK